MPQFDQFNWFLLIYCQYLQYYFLFVIFFTFMLKKKLQTKNNTEVIGNILIEIDWTDQITASATLLRWI